MSFQVLENAAIDHKSHLRSHQRDKSIAAGHRLPSFEAVLTLVSKERSDCR